LPESGKMAGRAADPGRRYRFRQVARVHAPAIMRGMKGSENCAQKLVALGIRPTAQRLQIAELLLSAPQHLSAEQILASLRASGARVSKATVYNTLNLFAAQGLIRQLSVDGARAWFDSNVVPHYHFHDEATGALTDVAVPEVEFSRLPPPPPGMEVAGIDLVIRLRKKM
jgi:Fur family transcriptional regulator, iron response regulator